MALKEGDLTHTVLANNLHIMQHIAEECLHGFKHMPVISCYFHEHQFVVFTVIA